MYYHIPVGNYRYKRLHMGVGNSMDNIQEKMSKMFHIFDFIQAYINDLWIITKGGW